MRIYNEIVFDVDGKVIYEDSYEYSGDVMLCGEPPSLQDLIKKTNEFRADGEYTAEEAAYIARMNAAMMNEVSFDEVDPSKHTFQAGNMGKVTVEEYAETIEVRGTTGSPSDIPDIINTGRQMKTQAQAQDIQLNPLPSLPSISNVGSVPFTGVVNWNSVPGGFQPLPQVAGSRNRKIYQLSQFHGGVNSKSSPSDISDTECRSASNLSFANVGRIKLLGDCLGTDNSLSASAATAPRCLPGYGLFQFTAPALANDTLTPNGTVFTMSADGNTVDYNDTNANGGFLTMAGSGATATAHVYYAAGNGFYAADASFNNTSRAKVFVDTPNQVATIQTWTEGNPLINSPSSNNDDATATTKVGINGNDGTDISATADGALEVNIFPTGTGTWDGKYFFYVSWLFDNGCETGLCAIGTDQFDSETLRLNPSLSHANTGSAPLGGDVRIEGARIYFKEAGTAERWLLAELSLEHGVRGALDSTFIPWTIALNVGEVADRDVHDLDDPDRLVFTDPPSVYSYASLNGYYANELYTSSIDLDQDDQNGGTAVTGPTPLALQYKTVVVGSGGIVFIGNVKFNGKHMPDSMMFSMPGRPAVFPKYNRFDSPSSDGSPIIALAAFRDTILQFKQNGMYVINVSNPAQFYAQASFRDCGVSNPCQVFTTSFGVIFVNINGCFIYDGQKVISLTNGKFNWSRDSGLGGTTPATEAIANTSTSAVPCVGYDPRSQSIVILKNIGDDGDTTGSTHCGGLVYNMITQSWSFATNMIANSNGVRHSNFFISSAGYLSILRSNSASLFNYNHDKLTDTTAQGIYYWTKDFNFGFPTQTKKIFKVYITYKGDGSALSVKYGVNGESHDADFTYTFNSTATPLADKSSTENEESWHVAELVPTTAAEATGIYSFALLIQNSANSNFEINDISIAYRVRPR